MNDFSEKMALVTGATSGIGRATALAFAREGARVVGRDAERGAEVVDGIHAGGGTAAFVCADLAENGKGGVVNEFRIRALLSAPCGSTARALSLSHL